MPIWGWRMIRGLCCLLALAPGVIHAEDGPDLIEALSASCIMPLETGGGLAKGLEVAPDEMAARLLNGKDAVLRRHPNPRILVVAHNSGDTCEVMTLGIRAETVADGIRAWAGQAGYTIADGENMALPTGGGAYLARALDEGFVQIFVHTDAARGFTGITAGRVADSAQAREVLGQ